MRAVSTWIDFSDAQAHRVSSDMAHVLEVAAYILEKKGPMTAMKLQKLVYYSQAWSLVWDERELFSDKIKAWANGPVVPSLYQAHKGLFQVGREALGPVDAGRLSSDERETIDAVLSFYGDKSAQWLSDLSHREPPWRAARGGTSAGENSDAEITQASMAEYYAGLDPAT